MLFTKKQEKCNDVQYKNHLTTYILCIGGTNADEWVVPVVDDDVRLGGRGEVATLILERVYKPKFESSATIFPSEVTRHSNERPYLALS